MIQDNVERDCIFSPTKNIPPRVFDVSLSTLYARNGGAVPQVLVDIISKLDKSRLRADKVFQGETNDKLVSMFKGLYDGHHNQPLNRCFEIYTVAGLLKELLRGLPKPIISDELALKFVNVGRRGARVAEADKVLLLQSLVTQISTCERRTLKYILFYLNRSCKQKSVCLTNASRRAISKIFVPILIRRIKVEEEDLSQFSEDTDASVAEKVIDLMIKECHKIFSPFSNESQNQILSTNDVHEGKQSAVKKEGEDEAALAGDIETSSAEQVAQAIDFNISLCVSSLFSAPGTTTQQMESTTQFTTHDVGSAKPRQIEQKSPKSKMVVSEREEEKKKSASAGALKECSPNIMDGKKKQIDLGKEQKVVAKPIDAKASDLVDMAILARMDDMSYEELIKEKKKIKRKIRMADNQLAKELGKKKLTQRDKEPLRPMYAWYFRIKRHLQNNKVEIGSEESSIIELLKY